MPWSEARVHRWLVERARRSPRRRALGSVGHDAAVLARPAGRLVVCTDQTIEGVHFAATARARAVGEKAARRALSDLAATAADPEALLLALAAPARTSEAWIRSVIEGVDAAARSHGAELVGGDLAAVEGPRSLAVTALGMLAGREKPPGRDRARAGEVVLLTGPVGGSLLGRHLAIEPRFAEARFLYRSGARALMDVSDGLALDLERLARLSGVRIDLEEVPVHADAHRAAGLDGRTPFAHALSDGEDHELLATIPRRRWQAIQGAAHARFPRLEVIGRVRAGRGLYVRDPGTRRSARWNGEGGWIHGR